MIEKHHIEEFLRANGVPPTADDEEIRSMLLSARWNDNEVDTALMVLKENINSKQTHVDTLHKVFQSDDRLTPGEITSLLGISVDIKADEINPVLKRRLFLEHFRIVIAVFLSILIAFVFILYFMYQNQAGPFYKPLSNADVDTITATRTSH